MTKSKTYDDAFAARQPLDYSFYELTTIAEIGEQDPRSGLRKRFSTIEPTTEVVEDKSAVREEDSGSVSGRQSPRSDVSGAESGDDADAPPPVQETVKPEEQELGGWTTAVRLNNNDLTDTEGIIPVMETLLLRPETLMWLDLSFNHISEISEDILYFTNLKVLNYHSNNITDIKQIAKLGGLPCLRSLTLHGNPLETKPNYKLYVLACIPTLQKLDFSPVTFHDRDKCFVYQKRQAALAKQRELQR
eukprot:Rmarinus@m.836